MKGFLFVCTEIPSIYEQLCTKTHVINRANDRNWQYVNVCSQSAVSGPYRRNFFLCHRALNFKMFSCNLLFNNDFYFTISNS